ncbi:hypothetical protein VIGAN_09052700 [Vigna angularis var. angularis]|uniref:Legume lectin domain-containing protein n=1 Tax=Vigna angularis var. angularis TaxID=157739 RepID=A0A0S3SW73_PHAAN|nr:hypothetical protein VIGAN_09052700 [Vigna angularis var. angularis]
MATNEVASDFFAVGGTEKNYETERFLGWISPVKCSISPNPFHTAIPNTYSYRSVNAAFKGSCSSSTQSLNLDPNSIDLFGDAHIVTNNDAAPHVHLTNPSLSSSGLLRVPEPLVFVDATTTLSTEFSFSISGNGDPNSSHVGIDVGSHLSLAVANASYVGLVLNNGEKLNAWVDYEGGPKVMEVRLSK